MQHVDERSHEVDWRRHRVAPNCFTCHDGQPIQVVVGDDQCAGAGEIVDCEQFVPPMASRAKTTTPAPEMSLATDDGEIEPGD